MMEQPKIAILLSTYNGEKYLGELLSSIYNQSYQHFEIFVRDDGSTDSTLKILENEFKKEKLKFYSGKNVGPGQSFWELLKNTGKYEFYAFADQDDVWEEDKLERAINILIQKEKKDTPLLYSSKTTIVNENLEVIGKDCLKKNQEIKNITYTEAFSFAISQGCTFLFNYKSKIILEKIELPKNILHDSLINKIIPIIGHSFYDFYSSLLYRQHDKNVVGVNLENKNIFKKFYKMIIREKNNDKQEIAQLILLNFKNKLDKSTISFLEILSIYNKSLIKKLKFYFYIRKNFELKKRLILLVKILFSKY